MSVTVLASTLVGVGDRAAWLGVAGLLHGRLSICPGRRRLQTILGGYRTAHLPEADLERLQVPLVRQEPRVDAWGVVGAWGTQRDAATGVGAAGNDLEGETGGPSEAKLLEAAGGGAGVWGGVSMT